ncbi:MAG: zinc ribbon domain-containing protein, partial [Solirubrobacteraceae bacterium]|nr:zinc ribbon domain-containing protein [Solirubrobacteraceae bacterium]
MTLTDDRQPPARPMPAGGPGAAPGTSGATDPADRPTSVSPVQPAPGKPRWEQCDRCQSPVDPAQRYCVVCGTNQRRADDPAARYFAAARRRRIGVAAPVAVVGNGRTVSTTVAALLIALLPVAAGIGIVVGRGSADSGDQIIQALKASQGTRGTVVAGPAVDGTTPDTTAVAGDTAASDDPKAKKKGKEVD